MDEIYGKSLEELEERAWGDPPHGETGLMERVHRLRTIKLEEAQRDALLAEGPDEPGGQVGGAVGYKYVWLGAELSIMGLSSTADVESSAYNRDLSLSGLVLYPALGIIVQI